MVWRRFLLVGVLLALAHSLLVVPPVHACSPIGGAAGQPGCVDGGVGDGSVDLWSIIDGGNGSGDDASGTPTVGGGESVPDPCDSDVCSGEYRYDLGPCPPDNPECGGSAPITLSDIASFRPDTGSARMEPDGWAVTGLPANFVADASTDEVAGTLLGAPATVRFTPIGYRWAHSDGITITSSHGGASWDSLGLSDFSTTPTSRIFEERGRYTVDVYVEYSAQYRYGAAWVPILGTLELRSDTHTVIVRSAKTVLVDRDCTAAPRGPGC